jgi:diacylglycerol kinase (ATP)
MKRWLAIVNPKAGGLGATERDRLIGRLRDRATVMLTERPRHATEIARAAAPYDGLIVAGGDGTLYEVLQAIELPRQHVAVLPTGRGNSLARDLGLFDLETAMRALESDRAMPVDLLNVRFDYFDGRTEQVKAASTVAVGYAADVVRRTTGAFQAWGRWCYAMAAATTRPRSFHGGISQDGAPARRQSLTGIIVNNTRHLANFRGFPDALINDGRADAIHLNAGFAGQLWHNAAVLGHAYSLTPVKPFPTRRYDVVLDAPTWLMIDGEMIAAVRAVSVTIDRAALRCHYA